MQFSRLLSAVAVLNLSVLLCACATVSPVYKPSTANQAALATIKISNISIGDFTQPSHISDFCRGRGPISPPNGMTFASFVRGALEQEVLGAGGIKSGDSNLILTGKLSEINFSSSHDFFRFLILPNFFNTNGYWNLSLELHSSNGKTLAVNEHYVFYSSFIAHIACNKTAKALPLAVNDLIHKIVINKKFPDLLISRS